MDVVLGIKELEKGHKLKVAATQSPESELLVNLFEKRSAATKSLKDQRLSPAFYPTSLKPEEKYWVLYISIQEMAQFPTLTTTKVVNKHFETTSNPQPLGSSKI